MCVPRSQARTSVRVVAGAPVTSLTAEHGDAGRGCGPTARLARAHGVGVTGQPQAEASEGASRAAGESAPPDP